VREEDPGEDMAAGGSPVARVVVQDRDAVFVEEVVEFFVDGVEADGGGERKAQGELEEEVWVAEEGAVDVEGRGGDGGGGCVGGIRGGGFGGDRDVWSPNGCCDIVGAMPAAMEDTRSRVVGSRWDERRRDRGCGALS